MIISHSSLAAWRACPRLYQHSFEEGWGAATPARALRIGSAIDGALTAAATGEDWAAAIIRNADAIGDDLPMVRALARGYLDHWGADAMPGEVIDTQVRFRAPLINPDTWEPVREVVLVGKIDALVRVGGRVLIVDHKTTSQITEAFWSRLVMDSQVSQYHIGAESLGYDVDGWVHNVIRKPSIRQRKDETHGDYIERLRDDIAARPSWYYQRQTVARSYEQIANYLRNVCSEVRRIDAGERPQNPDACFRWGGRPCDFYACCSTGTQPEQHPELYIHDNHHTQYEQETTV